MPAILWGVAFAILLRGLPIDADHRVHLSVGDVLNPYTLLGGLATASLFAFYGAVFIALKTAGPVRDDAFRFARMLSVPAIVLAGGFGLWTQLAHGKAWTWLALAVAVVALLTAVALMWARRREGWAFVSHSRRRGSGRRAAVRLDVSEPVAVHAQPGVERDDLQRVVDRLHAEDHVVGVVDAAAAGDRIPGLDLLGVPPPNHRRRDPRIHRTVEAVELNLLREALSGDAALPRRIGGVRCRHQRHHDRVGRGAGAHRGRRRSPTRQPARSAHWAGPLWILVALWVIRTLAHWLQGRLSQRGATAVIADLAGEVLRTVTALPPRQLAAHRDSRRRADHPGP